jgi:beta-hydroxylase
MTIVSDNTTKEPNFLNPDDFPFLKTIKDAYPMILKEFHAAVDETAKQWDDTRIHNGKWETIVFKYEGEDKPDMKAKFPEFSAFFDNLPVRIFTYGFSIMRAGCEIIPHTNDNIGILRSHLCLFTNPEAKLVVNNEARAWTPGEFFVFDDSNEHAAYNRGDTDRAILLFDFYRDWEKK